MSLNIYTFYKIRVLILILDKDFLFHALKRILYAGVFKICMIICLQKHKNKAAKAITYWHAVCLVSCFCCTQYPVLNMILIGLQETERVWWDADGMENSLCLICFPALNNRDTDPWFDLFWMEKRWWGYYSHFPFVNLTSCISFL